MKPIVLCLLCLLSTEISSKAAPDREAAYRGNNLGVALLEQFRHDEAAEAFRRALAADPSLSLARMNLAIALFNVPDLAQARKEAEAAAMLAADAPQPHYILGLIARAQNRALDAKAAFRKVLALDPADVGSLVNLGQLLSQERSYPEAIASLREAAAAEPYNATAVYNLGLALTRSAQAEEGQKMMERFRVLREGGYGTLIGQSYPDQGRYAEAVASTGAEADLVDPATPAVHFADATAEVLPVAAATGGSGRVLLFDLDGDGDLDLYDVGAGGQRLLRNGGGRFVDATAGLGLDPSAGGIGAVAGDYDNDGRPDLLVVRASGTTLHHSDGEKGFSDVTSAAMVPASPGLVAAALVDVDHDGDLDVFLGGFGAASRLLQNLGNGSFKEVTAEAGFPAAPSHVVAVVPTDFDNRRDIDLLAVHADAPPALFKNMRDGTFRDVAAELGLAGKGVLCAAAADVNKDAFTDFFFGAARGPGQVLSSDGRGRFVLSQGPPESAGATAAQFLDYDNDGLLDLAALTPRGARLFRNVGGGKWADVSAALPAGSAGGDATLASGDLDGDGDVDLVVRLPDGAARVWRNEGGNRNRSLRVQLAGLVSNRSGVGAKIEIRAGSLWQKLETYAATPSPAPADVVFGLGKRASADAVRVLWPAGVLQTELVTPSPGWKAALAIKELDRKPSSCPYLYAWSGERFEFVTDFMGGGEMGYWMGPKQWNQPVPEEYVRIRDDQLAARDGRYEIRVTNELEEAIFVDRLRLVVVAHPADVEVFPDEGLVGTPRPFKLYASRGARPPKSAVDDHGRNVLPRLVRLDREYPDDFRLKRIRGYAEEHTLTMETGAPRDGRTLLLLTGWTDYAFSSDNVAAHQAGLAMSPPALQVEDAQGRWQTVIPNVGMPVGRPQTIVADLTGRWRGPSRRVRLATNMRIYWDRILVDTSPGDVEMETTSLEPSAADLRERGFSAEISPDGREPFIYDYARVSWESPWKVMPGRYTRVGDVRELLRTSEDLFVVSRPGDEIALSFDAKALPPLPAGWRRTFLLHADGFSKEMDINSASPHAVEPLPFHGMARYPYEAPESYPMTPERRAILERYNTRLVVAPLPRLEIALHRSEER